MSGKLCCVVALALAVAGWAHTATGPFAYDSQAPLRLRVSTSWKVPGETVSEVAYQSPKGGRVPGILVVPQGRGPFAGLILQHGLPGSSRDMLDLAERLARTGAVVVAIDAPFSRPAQAGAPPVTFTSRDRANQIQLIVDLRRAVDLLRTRADVDASRIAYLGYSYGGAMGGLLAGVEHRIRAYVLDVGDGGLVEHFAGTPELAQLAPASRARWLAAMRPIEPLRWVRHSSPSSLYFQSARHDELVRRADTLRYYAAAGRPKSIDWYDSGHFLPMAALCDAARWLHAQVAVDARNLKRCAA